MSNIIINAFLGAVYTIASIFMVPLETLLRTFMPNLNDNISSALGGIYEAIDYIVYPATILPHSFLAILDLILALELAYLALMGAYYISTWVIRIIQHVNPFGSGV